MSLRRSLGLFVLLASVAFACSSAGLNEKVAPDDDSSSEGKKSKSPSKDGESTGDDDGDPKVDVPVTPVETKDLPVTSSGVRVIVMPSDGGKGLVDAIKNAKKSVHVTMYMLTDDDIEKAIVAQAKAGRDVKVVLNRSFPPDVSNANLPTYDALAKQNVQVVWAPSSHNYTHQKTFIIDGTEAWIMTMNATFSSPSNREYLVVDSDPKDVADAEALFTADYEDKVAVLDTKLVVSPENNSQLDARSRFLSLVDGAKSTLDIAGETMSDDIFVNAVIARKNAGVAVRIVIDGSNGLGSNAQQDSVAALKAASVPIVRLSKPSMHAKAIVADGTRAYVGSQNFTGVSMIQNRELGVIFDTPSEVAKVAETIAKDFAAGKAP